jgi:predicted porin
MKKHLIAIAVASAVATPAIAQVSLSGNLDIGVGKTEVNNVSRTSTVSGMFVTPDIRFSGSEDLGGGLRATFRLTQEFNVSDGRYVDSLTGTGTGATTAASTPQDVNGATTATFGESRFQETSVGLSGAFGSVKLGMFNHTARDNAGAYRFAGEFARVSGNFRSLGSKAQNSVEYTTPSIQGLSAAVGYSNKGTNKSDAGYAKQMTGSIGYAAGPMAVRYSRLQSENNTAGSTGKNIEQFFGGTYDLGVAKLGYLYAKESAAGARLETNVHVLNAAVPVSKGLTIHGSYHAYGNDTTANATGNLYALGATQDLSKRTRIYAGYTALKNNTGSNVPQGFLRGVANTTTSLMAVGVTHSF